MRLQAAVMIWDPVFDTESAVYVGIRVNRSDREQFSLSRLSRNRVARGKLVAIRLMFESATPACRLAMIAISISMRAESGLNVVESFPAQTAICYRMKLVKESS